ncbi:hypothetical protein AALO_G00052340 [Alosa alosa]|uniref:P2X purinoreceptor 7 intracellular domain-containing protein n=1 Tax=Alosa alosa TaxID=278164 RepID=A0AAV6H948_9TELE|nr:hypothetical protein AALO_G00052340 [Alosa alosa]
MHQCRHVVPPTVPGMPWCTCTHCRDMPTNQERKCCGQNPATCVSLLPHYTQHCLDEGFLQIHRQYITDITALGHVREPGDDNRVQICYLQTFHFLAAWVSRTG